MAAQNAVTSVERVQVYRLHATAQLPRKATGGAAGFDLFSCETKNISPGDWEQVRTGIILAIPQLYYGQIGSRSGLAINSKITAFPGVIDSDYRGEITIVLQNWGNETKKITEGERIAQILIVPIHDDPYLDEVDEVSETTRGKKGFGSTGNT